MAGVLKLDNLSVRYGTTAALDQVSVEIPPGSSVAVIGPNGSGKSTLLKAVAGILALSSGTVDHGDDEVAIVLQSTDVDQSVPLTVRDTVAMARFAHLGLLSRFDESDRVAIDAAIGRLQLNDLVDRQIHQLSGGQRQRAFVAQGLAQQADILLLDEPLTGLDVVSRSLIAEALEGEQAAGRTVIVSTHSFAEAERSDLVLLLATRTIAFGPSEAVLTEHHLRTAFGGRFIKVGNTLVLDDPHHEHAH
ncbi:MAG: metal ABC transporter ATP-binding protein [Actinomycetota bacterium]